MTALSWPVGQQEALVRLNDLAARAGVTFFDYQWAALTRQIDQPEGRQRVCLYYRTGAGKSLTALAFVVAWGHTRATVIAPPSTHRQWVELGERLGVQVAPMSHAKFRMPKTKLARDEPVVADEFHLFGGQAGKGWRKLDRMAMGLAAPLVLLSATPNYNDAERVYCVQHVLDPLSCRGGYIQFLYEHCNTEPNHFGITPLVNEIRPFKKFLSASEYLAALPRVEYLPDDLVYQIQDIAVPAYWPKEAELYGLNRRARRLIASQIEERHARVNLALVDDSGRIRAEIYQILSDIVGAATTPSLVFAAHSSVATALGASLDDHQVRHEVVYGELTNKQKEASIRAFTSGDLDVLVGTATLATGTDGIDKMCDTLVILDDTDDAALRRQLIGRIMPRGEDTDASNKRIYRLVLS